VAQYSIKELEHLSGVKAHTIRIWEQRYGILQPKRTETNIRYYDDDDLKSLLNIALLNEHGYKISKIAQMNGNQICDAVVSISANEKLDFSQQGNALLVAMVDLDEEAFDKVITTAIIQMGFERTMQELVYPFFHKIGILWQTGNINPAHEHFVSNLVRQKLIVAIDGQVLRRREQVSRYLLFLPEGELHELALLYMCYLLRSRHQQVLYLGQNLPFSDLMLAAGKFQPDVVCTVLTTTPGREDVQEYINTLSSSLPDSTVYVYGFQAQHDFLEFPDNVRQLCSMNNFLTLIDRDIP
jgi:MerR family transcriptional regulator, light-induced transcriptional regulator